MKTFDELQINKGILKAVVEMGFTEPTPVQAEVIPLMLNNTDCVALAPTGTGKTCAFGIPLIEMVDVEVTAVQAIIMCPTRELAMQIERELKRLCAYVERIRILAIYGGQNIDRQLFGLRKRPQILVCTPGRLLDHLRRHTITLTAVTSVVLDEADEMLEMGFREDIDTILETVPTTAQVTMFSATMSKDILAISTHYQNEPVTITLNDAEERPDIAQFFVKLSEKNKVEALQQIMTENNYNFVLVFCNTKRRVDNLNTELNRLGYTASALHGDLRQRQRDVVMRSYRAKNISILVATDVAARGIDVDNIEAIFNYDVPNNDEYYLHRIGRTARAKKSGVAYTFATKADFHRIRECEKYTETAMEELVLKGLSDNTITTNRQKSAVYTVRMFVNVGTKDGLTESTFADYIMASTNIKRGEIPEIRLMDIFGFIEVVPEKVDEIKLINGLKIGKRKLAIEVAGERAGSSASRGRSDGSSYDRKPREYGSRSGASSEARRPYGDRPARSEGSSEARRPYGDRPARSEGSSEARRPYGDRPARSEGSSEARRPYGDRPARSEGSSEARRPYGDRPARSEGSSEARRPYGDRPARSEGSSEARRPYGDRPARAEGSSEARRPYGDRPARSEGSSEARRPYGDRPARAEGSSEARRPYGDRPARAEGSSEARRPYGDRPARAEGSSEARRPYGDRPARAEGSSEARRPYGDRPARAEGSSEARRPYGDRPARSEGSSEARRPYGDRPARAEGSSETRRPYGDRPARAEGSSAARKPYASRSTTSNSVERSESVTYGKDGYKKPAESPKKAEYKRKDLEARADARSAPRPPKFEGKPSVRKDTRAFNPAGQSAPKRNPSKSK